MEHTIDEDRDVSEGEMLEYLETEGDLQCPGSRYGTRTSTCAPWAVAMQLIYWDANGGGDAPLSDSLDHFMGLVVNDHDDVLTLVADNIHALEGSDVEGVIDDAEDLLREDVERNLSNLNAPTLLRLRQATGDNGFCWDLLRDLEGR